MLVLTRKVGEEIIIGGNIVVKIVEEKNGKIRVGITADRNISVLRAELVPSPAADEKPARQKAG